MNDIEKNNNFTVYVHINKVNGKIYVGITGRNPEKRWQNGTAYRNNKHFDKAISKYGWDNFEHEVIASNLTEKEARNFEMVLISELNTMDRNKGYNLTLGGGGVSGYKYSDEQIAKMRKNNTGENNPMYGRTGDKHPLYGMTGELSHTYGRHHTDEAKEIIRNTHIGKKLSKEHKEKLSNSHKGNKHTEETKNKLSETRKGKDNLSSRSVVQLDLENNLIAFYETAIQAYEATGVSNNGICACCRGRAKTAGGYRWIYKEKYLVS